jgi:hypothetical protein
MLIPVRKVTNLPFETDRHGAGPSENNNERKINKNSFPLL